MSTRRVVGGRGRWEASRPTHWSTRGKESKLEAVWKECTDEPLWINMQKRFIFPRHETNYKQESWASRSPERNTLQQMGLKICSINGETYVVCLSTPPTTQPSKLGRCNWSFYPQESSWPNLGLDISMLTHGLQKKKIKKQERSEGTVCKGPSWGYLVCHDLSKEGNFRSQLLGGSSILREGFELIRPWKSSETLAIMCPGYPQFLTCLRMVWKSRLMKSQELTLQSQQLLQPGEQKPWSHLWPKHLGQMRGCRYRHNPDGTKTWRMRISVWPV